jgi:glycosyltransferase involved in cell wall biosynthesis
MLTEPTKILYHHRTGSLDGQAVHIEELVTALRNLGNEVIVVEPPAALKRKPDGPSPAFQWLRKRMPKPIYELLELAYNFPAYLRLRTAYLKHKPDIIYERHNLFLLAGALVSKRFGVPYILEVNSPLYLERKAHDGLVFCALAHSTERWTWRRADALLPVTSVLARIIRDEGVPAERIVVIPNGIDKERFGEPVPIGEAKKRLGLENFIVLGFTGFVREWNALDLVVEYLALPERSRCFLLVVGDGPARAALEHRARDMGVEARVRFTGALGRELVRDHVSAFDVALQPAANLYASPLKLVEYMALGRAVIAPRQPNILEMIRDGVNGMLFQPNDRQSLFDALDRLVRSPDLRKELGEAARRVIDERGLTWERNARRVTDLALKLCNRAPETLAPSKTHND